MFSSLIFYLIIDTYMCAGIDILNRPDIANLLKLNTRRNIRMDRSESKLLGKNSETHMDNKRNIVKEIYSKLNDLDDLIQLKTIFADDSIEHIKNEQNEYYNSNDKFSDAAQEYLKLDPLLVFDNESFFQGNGRENTKYAKFIGDNEELPQMSVNEDENMKSLSTDSEKIFKNEFDQQPINKLYKQIPIENINEPLNSSISEYAIQKTIKNHNDIEVQRRLFGTTPEIKSQDEKKPIPTFLPPLKPLNEITVDGIDVNYKDTQNIENQLTQDSNIDEKAKIFQSIVTKKINEINTVNIQQNSLRNTLDDIEYKTNEGVNDCFNFDEISIDFEPNLDGNENEVDPPVMTMPELPSFYNKLTDGFENLTLQVNKILDVKLNEMMVLLGNNGENIFQLINTVINNGVTYLDKAMSNLLENTRTEIISKVDNQLGDVKLENSSQAIKSRMLNKVDEILQRTNEKILSIYRKIDYDLNFIYDKIKVENYKTYNQLITLLNENINPRKYKSINSNKIFNDIEKVIMDKNTEKTQKAKQCYLEAIFKIKKHLKDTISESQFDNQDIYADNSIDDDLDKHTDYFFCNVENLINSIAQNQVIK